MEKRFKILRFIGTMYKVLGIITIILTVIGSAGSCLSFALAGGFFSNLLDQYGSEISGGMGIGIGIATGVGILLGGLLSSLTLYAFGEAVYLFIDLENNTRNTMELLRGKLL
ncbi:MAG TPA: hypothetical protein PKG95_13335 [Anaerolineaceae bacterium]|jgi:hypothetical protein|nr:hypothetical protein [Anaerolineaceae bacterium]